MDYADRHSDFDRDRFDPQIQTLLEAIVENHQRWSDDDPDPTPVTEALKYHSRPVQRPDREDYDGDDEYVEQVLQDVLGFDQLIPFQEQCWTRLNEMRQARLNEGENQAAMLAAPTGFGKTEGFSGPLFHDLAFNDGDGFGKTAIVYPRNALLEDQLERFLVTLHEMNEEYDAGISIGIYNGDVPQDNSGVDESSLVNNGEFTVAQWTGGEHEDDPIAFEWDDDTHTLSAPGGPTFGEDTLKLSRNAIQPDNGGEVPDILLTTINSLENFALKPNYDIIDEFRTVIFDEVHLYNGIYGAHASRIIDNTKKTIANRVDDDVGMLFIGSSATIDQPEEFGSDLFGVDSGNISVITTGPEDKQETDDTEHFHFVTSSEEVGTSSTFIQQILLFAHALLDQRDGRERKKALAFIDSVSQVNQRYFQIEDFENEDRWSHHNTDPDDWDAVANETPYRTARPDETLPGHRLIQNDLNTERTMSDLRLGADEFGNTDLILSTSLLEVGIDIPAIKVISQYRAPWEMSQFVQRIGRASRQEGNDAHFLVTLENEGGDRTLFHRADRFLEPEISTPLNVDNDILIWIHDQLYRAFDIVYEIRSPSLSNNEERERFLESFLNGSDEAAFQAFNHLIQNPSVMLQRTLEHPVRELDELETTDSLRRTYGTLQEIQDRVLFTEMAGFVGEPATRFTLQLEGRDDLDEWMEQGLQDLHAETAEQLADIDPETAATEQEVDDLLNEIDQINEIVDADDMDRRDWYDEADQLLYDIHNGLITLTHSLDDPPDAFPYNLGYEEAMTALRTARGIREDDEIRQESHRWQQAYYLKKSLQELYCFIGHEFERENSSNTVYGHLMVRAFKALLRAVYFFERAISLDDTGEQLQPPHYVPTSYFAEAGETFSIVPEEEQDEDEEEDRVDILYDRRFVDNDDDEDGDENDAERTEAPLTTLFFEYAPYMAKYMADQSLQMFNPPVEEAPPGAEADYYFDVSGLSTEPGENVITPNTLPVKRVRDFSGNRAQSVVRYCTESLYVGREFWDVGPHGSDTMEFGQLHSDPQISTNFDGEAPVDDEISVTYMSPDVRLDAVELTITPADPMGNPGVGESTPFNTHRDAQEEELIAFERPLGFSLQTRGAVWNLDEFINDFLDGNEYQQFRDRFETHNDEDNLVDTIHYTAAHFLLEVIADISGVNQAQLLYGVDPENHQVAVFEYAEGGQGIVDLFDDVRNRPMHEKMLRSINRVASNPQLINGYLWTDQEFVDAVRNGDDDLVRDYIKDRVTVATENIIGDVDNMVRNTDDRIEEFAVEADIEPDEAYDLRQEVVRRQFLEGDHAPAEDIITDYDLDVGAEKVRNLLEEPDVDGCIENLHQAYSIAPGDQSNILSFAVLEPLYEHVITRTDGEEWGNDMLDNEAIHGAQIDGENIFHSL
ncbi:DEAD/DEAH box helicase [Haloterrigena sp. SYSU A121-1]|uniref:DEAD/DEAH box helicase n=1 Tax=Haloterrigena gelatinilytica TaxID=2741724 RepID=A0A8J8KHG9_9EURY|nr:helicase-related protein [Haloterrigena gelatinilytica]NUB91139.1 DEAD/DEAH box helicase [Haloterrigena gelatinilytica]